jgi:hypothetical protein
VRLALDTRLRGYDEVTFFLKINRKGRRGSAKVAEQVVLYGVPLLNIGPILILRRRGSAVSKEGLEVGCLQRAPPSRRYAPQGEGAIGTNIVTPDLIRGPERQVQFMPVALLPCAGVTRS